MNKSIEKTIPELNGKIISTNPTIGYEVMETIVYYDMPLLTLDKNEAGQKSLTVWMDVDNTDPSNRKDFWAFVPIQDEDVSMLLTNKMTLLDAFLKNDLILIEEVDSKDNSIFREFSSSEFPRDMLPTENSYLRHYGI